MEEDAELSLWLVSIGFVVVAVAVSVAIVVAPVIVTEVNSHALVNQFRKVNSDVLSLQVSK